MNKNPNLIRHVLKITSDSFVGPFLFFFLFSLSVFNLLVVTVAVERDNPSLRGTKPS
jgi:hypothetical protein